MESEIVVTVTPTIMDGTVVRWYRHLRSAENDRPMISASRRGVAVHTEYLTDLPGDVVDTAREIFAILKRDRNADVRSLATHRHKFFGPFELIER